MTPALLDAGRAGDVAAAPAALDAGADPPGGPDRPLVVAAGDEPS